MAQVTVTIGGRDYKMACGEGEEQNLLDLGRMVEERHARLKRQFGEVGDIRLSVMTAIMMADELNEAARTRAALEAEIADLRSGAADAGRALDGRHADAARAIAAAADRLERLADELTDGARRE